MLGGRGWMFGLPIPGCRQTLRVTVVGLSCNLVTWFSHLYNEAIGTAPVPSNAVRLDWSWHLGCPDERWQNIIKYFTTVLLRCQRPGSGLIMEKQLWLQKQPPQRNTFLCTLLCRQGERVQTSRPCHQAANAFQPSVRSQGLRHMHLLWVAVCL